MRRQTAVDSQTVAQLTQFVHAGGRVLLLNAGKELPLLFPAQVTGYRATKSGEVVTMHVAESPVFSGPGAAGHVMVRGGPEYSSHSVQGSLQHRSQPVTM